jgi:PAS domain S-box-containing protein
MKSPVPENEAERLATLHRYQVLDTPSDEAFDDLTLLAAHICEASTAMVSLVDENRQWFKSRVGQVPPETAREISFCAHTILQSDAVFEVPDAAADPRFSDSPLVTREPHFRFYAGAPLVAPNGHVLGAVCVMDGRPRTLSPGQRAALQALSRRAVAQLELRRRARELADSEQEASRSLALAERARRALLSVLEDEKRVGRSLRESEERFRQLAENISEVFWMIDPATRTFLYVSPAYEKIWGRTCASLYATSSLWLEAVHSEDRTRIAAVGQQVEGGYDETYRIVRPDGSTRWVRDRASVIRDAAGQAHRIVGIAEDITERRRLEQQFRQAQKMEAIGTLAGGIAHDFNNILGAINGYTELARMITKENPSLQEYLGYVQQAGARAAELVRQILAFSRRDDQARQPVQLRHVVTEALKLLRATIPSSVEIRSQLERLPPTVLADPTQVHQIMMNLCTNAWHAMRERPGRLEVTLATMDLSAPLDTVNAVLPPGRYTCLSVADTGFGMDEATLGRIFDPFFTTKQPGEGTGLGLAVVHGIVQSHNAGITVTSRPSEGTTFRIYFPALDGSTDPVRGSADEVPRGQGQRILVIDDEEVLVRVAQTALELLGYVVETQTNPIHALEEFRRRPQAPDLVITDLTMPRMSGIDLARALHELRPDLPLILTTGHAAAISAERARALGIRELLYKPLSFESLGATVHRVLAGRNA